MRRAMDQQHSSSMLIPVALVLLLLVIFTPLSLQDDRDRTFHDCYSTENSTTTLSAFTTNLNSFLSNLSSQLTPLNYYPTFYNASVGAPGPGAVFGFAQCISAGTAGDCSDCLRGAASEILQLCPRSKKAFLLHTYCILRYSNESFYSKPDQSIREVLWSSNNSTDPWLFNTKMADLMGKLSPMAASSLSKIALGFIKYDDYANIYGMVQCTRDISSNDCFMCLMNAIGYVPFYCRTRKGCTAYAPSCSLRYENYVFTPAFNTSTDVLALPPQPPQAASNPSPPPLSEVGVLPAASPSKSDGITARQTRIIITVTVSAAAIVFALLIAIWCFWNITRKYKQRTSREPDATVHDIGEDTGNYKIGMDIDESKFIHFRLDELKAATNGMSNENKLGQGGYGSIYKGKLSDGKEVAVKRLNTTSSSTQGKAELENEIAIVAKLQHKNLVQLLGCCLEDGENLLVYEYMPNKSLEHFIFDPIKGAALQWRCRYTIIEGVARGLMYLHEDSRLRIVHRDLKASNILLDSDMIPKISDFGLAKIFDMDQTGGSTKRIAGTLGYMAPEYAIHGRFSTKSDVYSFGVLVIEIITGRKNSSSCEPDGANDLLNQAWKHWRDGTIEEMLDGSLLDREHLVRDVARCIHIGLLCVQDEAVRRPNMSSVAVMLSSDSITLPIPSAPAFHEGRHQMSYTNSQEHSVDQASMSGVDPR